MEGDKGDRAGKAKGGTLGRPGRGYVDGEEGDEVEEGLLFLGARRNDASGPKESEAAVAVRRYGDVGGLEKMRVVGL